LIRGDVAGKDALRKSQSRQLERTGSKLDGKLTAMHDGMKGLDAATEHLRCLGDIGDVPST
jgi:hypothetical protein